jgi:hypothetical protein
LYRPGYFKISFLKDVQIVRDDPGWRFGKAPPDAKASGSNITSTLKGASASLLYFSLRIYPQAIGVFLRVADHFPNVAVHDPMVADHFPTVAVHDPMVANHFPTVAVHNPMIADHFPTVAVHDPMVADQFPIVAVHDPVVADQFSTVAVHYPVVADHFPTVAA